VTICKNILQSGCGTRGGRYSEGHATVDRKES